MKEKLVKLIKKARKGDGFTLIEMTLTEVIQKNALFYQYMAL